jgi:hypothetical protein
VNRATNGRTLKQEEKGKLALQSNHEEEEEEEEEEEKEEKEEETRTWFE